MKILTKINHIMKKKALSLGAVFLIFMNIVMLITIIAMMAYFMQVSKNLMDKNFDERQMISKSIANVIYSTTKESFKKNDFETLDEITNRLIDNRLINFVVIYGQNNNIVWSSIEEVANKKLTLNEIKKIYAKQFPYNTNIRYEQTSLYPHYNIIIAYTLDSSLSYYIEDMTDKNPTIAIIFLFFGSFCVLLMIKLVIAPINSLTNAVKIFSAGDFRYKIPMSYYKELNILTRAFNEMASIIHKTHLSLEEKIEERTMEISHKNEQLNTAMKELKETQSMLVHAEKMRSLGELVAGITHEINNPVNFIYGNLTHLNNYSQDLIDIIDKYIDYIELLPVEKRKELQDLLDTKEYSYIKEDLPELIKSCKEGTVRTKNIVMDLKNFSRTEKMVINEIDINKEINTTLNILYNKYKNRITVHKEFDEVSTIDCYGGQINQVLMNIIDNAIFAIKGAGDIYIRTKDISNNIIIEIEDTGVGIPKENFNKVFEPFFTTKGVGEGTGLGMSISYKIIETHAGKIEIDSEVGRGTKFTIILPKDGLKKKGNENNGI